MGTFQGEGGSGWHGAGGTVIGATPQWYAAMAAQQGGAEQAGDLMQNLVGSYQSAYGQARAANEGRYQEILGGLGQLGQQSRADIDTRARMRESAAGQDLVSRGLTGSTIMPSVSGGIERQRQEETNRLNDMLAERRFGFMERREDAYPDMGMYANLMSMIGSAGTNLPGMLPGLQGIAGLLRAQSGVPASPRRY